LHLYLDDRQNVEIRASTSCCDAFFHLAPESQYVHDLQVEAESLGFDVLERFRSVYPGSYSGVLLKTFDLRNH
jgi:hypothetical protein